MPTPEKEYRTIPLTQNQVAIVDACDFEWLSRYKWFARWAKNTKSFYAARTTPHFQGKQSTVFMHREILGLTKGNPNRCDHHNHDTLDNRRENLRLATATQNSQNRIKQSRNKSGFKGVSIYGRHFRAHIRVNGKLLHLGIRPTAIEAYALYREASIRFHGEFAHP